MTRKDVTIPPLTLSQETTALELLSVGMWLDEVARELNVTIQQLKEIR